MTQKFRQGAYDGWVKHHDALGLAHRDDGPALIDPVGNGYWYWHGVSFHSSIFDESWPDDKKAWWMRAKMESNK